MGTLHRNGSTICRIVLFRPLMHNVEKWPNIRVHTFITSQDLRCVQPFFNIIMEVLKSGKFFKKTFLGILFNEILAL